MEISLSCIAGATQRLNINNIVGCPWLTYRDDVISLERFLLSAAYAPIPKTFLQFTPFRLGMSSGHSHFHSAMLPVMGCGLLRVCLLVSLVIGPDLSRVSLSPRPISSTPLRKRSLAWLLRRAQNLFHEALPRPFLRARGVPNSSPGILLGTLLGVPFACSFLGPQLGIGGVFGSSAGIPRRAQLWVLRPALLVVGGLRRFLLCCANRLRLRGWCSGIVIVQSWTPLTSDFAEVTLLSAVWPHSSIFPKTTAKFNNLFAMTGDVCN